MSRKRKRSASPVRLAQNVPISFATDPCKGFVELNVGGKIFYTTKETLCRGDNFFSGLFRSLANNMSTTLDNQGRIFVDRDPELFQIILSYLRSGIIELPNQKIRRSLMKEFDFYSFSPPDEFKNGPHILHLYQAKDDASIKAVVEGNSLPSRKHVLLFFLKHNLMNFYIKEEDDDHEKMGETYLFALRDKLIDLGFKETPLAKSKRCPLHIALVREVY